MVEPSCSDLAVVDMALRHCMCGALILVQAIGIACVGDGRVGVEYNDGRRQGPLSVISILNARLPAKSNPWSNPQLCSLIPPSSHACPPFMFSSAQALYHAHALSEGGQRHVTIADLSQGVIHPSKVRKTLCLLLARQLPRGRCFSRRLGDLSGFV